MSGSTIYYVAQSLDGFIADRSDALDWLLDFGFDDFQQQYDDFLAGVGAVVMCAGTYRWLAAQGATCGSSAAARRQRRSPTSACSTACTSP